MDAAYSALYSDFLEKSAVVVGLDKTGLSCAVHLVGEGYDVEIADTRMSPPLESVLYAELPGVTLHKGAIQPKLFVNVDMVVLTGNAINNRQLADLAKQYGCEVVSSLELFARSCSVPVVLIGGDNGKSTVADMVKEVFVRTSGRVRIGGSCSAPVLDMLIGGKPDAYLIEVSSIAMFAQTRSLVSEVATLLNFDQDQNKVITSVHHDAAMRNVFKLSKNRVLNRDDNYSLTLAAEGQSITFGSDQPSTERDFGVVEDAAGRWFARGSERIEKVEKFELAGPHNELNILAAFAILESLGKPVNVSVPIIRKFRGLPYCCTDIGAFEDGVRWINDSKSTNLNAAIAAVQSCGENVVLIAGGVSEGADFSKLTGAVNGSLRGCVLFGRDGKRIGNTIKNQTKIKFVENIYEAVSVAANMAKRGDDIVFSPGCAPFDMFIDQIYRGQAFKQAVDLHYS